MIKYRLAIPTIATATAAIALYSPAAQAAARIITIDDLDISRSNTTLQVPAGDGLAIVLPEGQTITGADFGDPTKFVLRGTDGKLCYLSKDKECTNKGARIVRIVQVSGIKIAGITESADGGTTLTLVTKGRLGERLLNMRLIPVKSSTLTAIVVKENEPMPLMVAQQSRTQYASLQPRRSVESPVLKQAADRIRQSRPEEQPNVAIAQPLIPPPPTKDQTEHFFKHLNVTQAPAPSQQFLAARVRPMRPKSLRGRMEQIYDSTFYSEPSIEIQSQQSPAPIPLAIGGPAVPVIEHVVSVQQETAIAQPDSSPTDVVSVQGKSAISKPVPTPYRREKTLDAYASNGLAGAMVRGLEVNGKTVKVKPLYGSIQNVLIRIRRGQDIKTAAKASGVDAEIIVQLITRGAKADGLDGDRLNQLITKGGGYASES